MSTELLILLPLGALVLANVALEFIARWRNPPIGEFLDIDNVRLHFIIVGDLAAPPLVMFHGNGTLLQDFTISGLVDAAAKKFRVICFDRPGFGHSSRPRTVIWGPERQAELFSAADAARHRAPARSRPLVGHAGRAGDGRAQQRARERFSPGLAIISRPGASTSGSRPSPPSRSSAMRCAIPFHLSQAGSAFRCSRRKPSRQGRCRTSSKKNIRG
jgi:alpha/beta hydrolase fold